MNTDLAGAPPALFGVVPTGWRLHGPWGEGYRYAQNRTGLRVIVDAERKLDGRYWLHVSFSHPEKLPSYDDTCEVKRVFVGLNLKAVMVFPPEKEHVNIHPHCLHLWACLTEDVLPDFTEGTGSI